MQTFQADHSRRANVVIFIFIFLTVFSVFSKSLNYPFSKLDDYSYVVRNGDIRQINFEMAKRWFTNDYVMLYVPVTIASFAFDYQIWKLKPFGYRLTNLIIHAINSFLVYLILAQLTGNWALALCVSVIFGIHPVQIESVAWVTERKNILSTFFVLIATLQYFRKRVIAVGILFAFALLSKPSVVVFPVLLLCHDYFFSPIFSGRKQALFYLSLFTFAILASFLTIHFHATGEFYFRGGSFWTNSFVMMTVFFRYFQLLLVPHVQQIFYVTKIYDSFWCWPVFFSFTGIVTLLASILIFRKRYPQICFFVCWYLIFMVPVSNIFFPISTIMNDRYLYVSMVGFFTAILLALNKFSNNILFALSNKKNLIASFTCAVLIILPFVARSTIRLNDWKDPVGIWQAGIDRNALPDPRFHIGKAIELYANKDFSAAIREMEAVLEYSQKEESLLWQIQNYLSVNDLDKAYEHLQKIDRLPGDGGRTAAYYDFYAQYFEQKGKLDEAEKYYLESLAVEKKIPAYIHLAQLYLRKGNTEQAVKTYEDALRVDADSPDVLVEACKLYLHLRDYERAYPIYQHLLKLYPDDPFTIQISKQLKSFQKEAPGKAA